MYFKFFEVTDNCAHRDQIMPAVRNGAGSGNATPFYQDSGNGTFTKANTVLWEESHDTYVDGTTTSLNVVQRGKIWALTAGRAGFTSDVRCVGAHPVENGARVDGRGADG